MSLSKNPTAPAAKHATPAPPPNGAPAAAAPAQGAAAVPRGVAEPAPNPLKSTTPPPPALPKRKPGRPPKPKGAAAPATNGAPPPPSSPAAAPADAPQRRVLPEDPVQREKELAEVRPTAQLILMVGSALAARLPPHQPLTPEELEAIGKPLELVLHKYNGNMSPEWQLVAAIGGVATMRYVAASGFLDKLGLSPDAPTAAPKPPAKPAAASTALVTLAPQEGATA